MILTIGILSVIICITATWFKNSSNRKIKDDSICFIETYEAYAVVIIVFVAITGLYMAFFHPILFDCILKEISISIGGKHV